MAEFVYRVAVLGCKVNQYESEQIRSLLSKSGGVESEGYADCDLIVIHSCAVTAAAVRKVRQMIRQAEDKSSARIVLSGCAARSGVIDSQMPYYSGVEPGLGWIERLARSLRKCGFPIVATPDLERDILPLDSFTGHQRAFLKIQDGCDIHCSYCIVPSLRGPSRDKPLGKVLSEAERLVAGGHREIVLTGVSVGLYGSASGISLAKVLGEVARVPGLQRLRLSSLHPSELNEDLLEVWSRNPNIMPHIHLPLQSGSDRVLRAMRRGYDAAEFARAVERAQGWLDTPAITTDIIVGFPGESEDDFEATLDLAQRVGFSRIHVFPYSPRPGTAAAALSGRIDSAVVKDRMRRMRDISSRLKRAFCKSLLGRATTVLVERRDGRTGTVTGYSGRYVPTSFSDSPDSVGQVHRVRMESLRPDGVVASKIP